MMRGWGKDLETGYAELDRQHRVLLGLAHEFVDAAHNGTPPLQVAKIFEKFVDYANRHFSTEEGLMDTFDYPEKGDHIVQHREMQAHLARISERLRHHGHSALLNLLLRGVLRQWFNEHIRTYDKRLVANLANQVNLGTPTKE